MLEVVRRPTQKGIKLASQAAANATGSSRTSDGRVPRAIGNSGGREVEFAASGRRFRCSGRPARPAAGASSRLPSSGLQCRKERQNSEQVQYDLGIHNAVGSLAVRGKSPGKALWVRTITGTMYETEATDNPPEWRRRIHPPVQAPRLPLLRLGRQQQRHEVSVMRLPRAFHSIAPSLRLTR